MGCCLTHTAKDINPDRPINDRIWYYCYFCEFYKHSKYDHNVSMIIIVEHSSDRRLLNILCQSIAKGIWCGLKFH